MSNEQLAINNDNSSLSKLPILIGFFFILFCVSSVCDLSAQLRSFDQIFPSLSAENKTSSFSEKGYAGYSRSATASSLLGGSNSTIPAEITNNILNRSPGWYIECINVFPCDTANLSMLDIYNALGNIRGLKGRVYDSKSKGQVPLFEEATRIAGHSHTSSSIPDPPPANSLPSSKETIYIKLKDNVFGNTYYRGEISVIQNGLSYSLTNFRNMTYILVTAFKTEDLTAQLYIEPIKEGILIYSIAGADVSDFVENRISVDTAIIKRVRVIAGWAKDEILKKVNR